MFTLEHIEGHPVSLSDYRGRSLVVAFSSRHTAEEMAQGIRELRRHYDHEQLPVLALADLAGIPRPARAIAKRQLKSAYEDAVRTEAAELEAAGKPVPSGPQLVIMLPDWDGEVTRGFGLTDVDQAAAMALIDADGNVSGWGRGAEAAQQVMALFK